jgi:hypothetical protein
LEDEMISSSFKKVLFLGVFTITLVLVFLLFNNNKLEVKTIVYNSSPYLFSFPDDDDFSPNIEMILREKPEKLFGSYKYVSFGEGNMSYDKYLEKHPNDAVIMTALPGKTRYHIAIFHNSPPDNDFLELTEENLSSLY